MYKRRNELTAAKVTALAVAAVCAGIYLTTNRGVSVETNTAPVQMEQIVVDAGHGGLDGGAVGIHGEIEKDINLAIAKKLEAMLTFSGFDVVMTRDDDESIHDKGCETVAEQKRSDIKNRLKIIEANPNCIAVSIHQNKFEESSSRGAQMFYAKQNPLSQELANSLQTAFVTNLQADNTRQVKEGTHSVYLLEHATVPMVLVECGFLSNGEESVLLTDDAYQQKVAFTIYCGILNYKQNQEVQTPSDPSDATTSDVQSEGGTSQ